MSSAMPTDCSAGGAGTGASSCSSSRRSPRDGFTQSVNHRRATGVAAAEGELADGPADAAALFQTPLDRRSEVDPPVEPGDRRLFGAPAERLEAPRRQPPVVVRVVVEGVA